MPQRRSHFPNASSTPTPLKRARSPSNKSTPPSRQSKRIKPSPITSVASKSTPKKSQYFEHDRSEPESESEIDKEESGYEDEDESASLISSPPESEVDDEDNYESGDDVPRKGKKKGRPRKSNGNGVVVSAGKKGQELVRRIFDSDSSSVLYFACRGMLNPECNSGGRA